MWYAINTHWMWMPAAADDVKSRVRRRARERKRRRRSLSLPRLMGEERSLRISAGTKKRAEIRGGEESDNFI